MQEGCHGFYREDLLEHNTNDPWTAKKELNKGYPNSYKNPKVNVKTRNRYLGCGQ